MKLDIENKQVSVNEIVLDAIVVLKEKQNRHGGKDNGVKDKGTRDNNQNYETSDIRYIVQKGKENNKMRTSPC